MDDENLLIFYFNNVSDIQEEEHPEDIPVNRANNFFRKIRSKSEVATYIPDEELDLDDEFFHKYSWFQPIYFDTLLKNFITVSLVMQCWKNK